MIEPKKIVKAVKDQTDTLQANYKMLDILEGNLEPYVIESLRKMLSPRVLTYALQRLTPINVVPRYVDKLANIYQTGVTRRVMDGTDSDTDLLGWYEQKFKVNTVMHQSNRLFNACRASLIQPYIGVDGPALRVIPNDRFVVVSYDEQNPTKPTMVILIAGKDDRKREVYWVYTDTMFAIVRSDETIDLETMAQLGIPDGVNPYGVLPFVYTNQSHLKLVPIPDTDTMRMAEYIPSALTDLNLAACFSAFSMTYIKNGEIADPTYAPNALWFLKSDDPEKDVEIGTLKPEVDYQEVLNLIQTEMSMWLGSKGIKTGSIGILSPDSAASGIAKMIDEADTFDVRQTQAMIYQESEKQMWDIVLKNMHPVWVTQGLVENRTIFTSGASVVTKFSVIPVGTQRAQLIQEQRDEFAAGFTTRSRAIAALNPQMSSDQIEELEREIDEERGVTVETETPNEVDDADEMAAD